MGVRSATLASGPRGGRPNRTNAVEIHLTRKRTITIGCEDSAGDAQQLSRRLAGVLLPAAGDATGPAAPGA